MLELQRKKNSFMVFFFFVAADQLWSQELIDLSRLKILEVEWDWWQSRGSVNMGPRWPDGISTALQVQWSECPVLYPWAPWKGLRLSWSARAKPSTYQRICGSLCEDHGPTTCQPWLNSCLTGQWKISINHYLKPIIQWQQIQSVNILSSQTIL